MFKLRVGDEVLVTTGKDKGKKGKVDKVFLRKKEIQVSGVNIYKRHKKVTRTQKAGIYEITRPIVISKVLLICPKCGKTTRVGFTLEGKTKVRICKKCNGRLTA